MDNITEQELRTRVGGGLGGGMNLGLGCTLRLGGDELWMRGDCYIPYKK